MYSGQPSVIITSLSLSWKARDFWEPKTPEPKISSSDFNKYGKSLGIEMEIWQSGFKGKGEMKSILRVESYSTSLDPESIPS